MDLSRFWVVGTNVGMSETGNGGSDKRAKKKML